MTDATNKIEEFLKRLEEDINLNRQLKEKLKNWIQNGANFYNLQGLIDDHLSVFYGKDYISVFDHSFDRKIHAAFFILPPKEIIISILTSAIGYLRKQNDSKIFWEYVSELIISYKKAQESSKKELETKKSMCNLGVYHFKDQ